MISSQALVPQPRHDHAPARREDRAYDLPRPTMAPTISPAPAGRPRLLLVEDDAAMRAMLLEVLSRCYEVEAVGDGLAAWQTVQQAPPAMLIVDLRAPGKDSLILIRSLREERGTAGIPIILLSVATERELLLRCLAAGGSNFLLKPFGMNELLTFLRVEMELHHTLAGPNRGRGISRPACA